jgi:hypothetical protein
MLQIAAKDDQKDELMMSKNDTKKVIQKQPVALLQCYFSEGAVYCLDRGATCMMLGGRAR